MSDELVRIAKGPVGANEGTVEVLCSMLRGESVLSRVLHQETLDRVEYALAVLHKVGVLDSEEPYEEYFPIVDGVSELLYWCKSIVNEEDGRDDKA